MGKVEERCEITGNRCGTNNRPVGSPCLCKSCIKWFTDRMSNLNPEIERVVNEYFWELV